MRLYNKSQTTIKILGHTFVRMLIVIIVLFSIVLLVNRFIIVDEDITELESALLVRSIMSNPHGPSFVDESTGRVYPYLIDVDFFRNSPDEKLSEVFDYSLDSPYVAMKISLQDFDGGGYRQGGWSLPSAYLNKRYYEAWEKIATTDVQGAGSVYKEEQVYFVNVIDGDERKKGFLKIIVLLTMS